jgi:hypothetical protein
MVRVCYCHAGYYGRSCSKESPVKEKLTSLAGYQTLQLTDSFTLGWRNLQDKEEMEVVLRYSPA